MIVQPADTRTRCAGCDTPLPLEPGRPGRARKWCTNKCRKASYGDPCVDCGARTRYGAERARVPEPRCAVCAPKHRTWWTRERIIDRIREWATIYGEPPAGHDWNSWSAEHQLHDPVRAKRFRDADGYWPAKPTVVQKFSSWNAALVAAGFPTRAAHGGSGNADRRRSVRERVVA